MNILAGMVLGFLAGLSVQTAVYALAGSKDLVVTIAAMLISYPVIVLVYSEFVGRESQ